MTKVSVIIPTYNRAWIVGRAIKSVLAQTYQDFEIIVVDDGSSDETSTILLTNKEEKTRLITLPKNYGPSYARNAGLKEAKGELIAYLDSDNIWFPNFLETMVRELTDDYVLTYSGQNTLLATGSKDNFHIIGQKVRNESYNPINILKYNFIDTSAVLYRKLLHAEIGYWDEDLKTMEDWDLYGRIVLAHPWQIKHVDQILGDYYYFTKDTAETVENSFAEEWILRMFDQIKPTGDKKYIVDKLRSLGRA